MPEHLVLVTDLGGGAKSVRNWFDLPMLMQGERRRFTLKVNTAMVGWTEIRLITGFDSQHETLYTYPVRAEDAVGWGVLSIFVAAAVGVVAHFLFG